MKKLVLALILISTACFSFAQAPQPATSTTYTSTTKSTTTTDDNHGFRIGVQISPALAWLKSQDNFSTASKVGVGFGFGLMLDYDFTKHYAFSTGLYLSLAPASIGYIDTTKFNSQGANKVYPAGTSVNYNLEYIEIPLTLKLKTNEIGYVTYFVQAGVQPGINIKAKGDIKVPPGSAVDNVVDGALGKDITVINLSLSVGAGIEYSLSGNTSAYASLNFINGFLDATNNPSSTKLGYSSKANFNQLALRLGIFF